MTVNTKIKVLIICFAISGCNTHFKCEMHEITGDKQSIDESYKIFSIKRKFQQSKRRPLGSRKPAHSAREGEIEVHPESRFVTAVGSSISVKPVTERHKLVA